MYIAKIEDSDKLIVCRDDKLIEVATGDLVYLEEASKKRIEELAGAEIWSKFHQRVKDLDEGTANEILDIISENGKRFTKAFGMEYDFWDKQDIENLEDDTIIVEQNGDYLGHYNILTKQDIEYLYVCCYFDGGKNIVIPLSWASKIEVLTSKNQVVCSGEGIVTTYTTRNFGTIVTIEEVTTPEPEEVIYLSK